VVRGDTRHYEQVADGCSEGLMRVALDYGLPVCNGVLAVEDHADAQKRAGGSHGNKGEEAALVAIEIFPFSELNDDGAERRAINFLLNCEKQPN
jgi:6,7-dimethyl-8-ribityllumazine synthase